MDLPAVRRMALALPEVEERTAWGTPAYYVRKKIFARHHEDGEHLAIKVDPAERDGIVASDPETFVVTPHYEKYPWMLVTVGRVRPDELAELLLDAWRVSAPKRLVASHDEAHPTG